MSCTQLLGFEMTFLELYIFKTANPCPICGVIPLIIDQVFFSLLWYLSEKPKSIYTKFHVGLFETW